MSLVSPQLQFVIQHTWDGQEIAISEQVRVSFESVQEGLKVSIEAPFYNDPMPDADAGSCWELWNYEVVEAFLVGADGHYTEIEWGPGGHYLLLRLDGPRSMVDHGHEIAFSAKVTDDCWQGQSLIPWHLLPQKITHFNLFAIHGQQDGDVDSRRYLCHSPLPAAQPDFHQPHRFAKWPMSEYFESKHFE